MTHRNDGNGNRKMSTIRMGTSPCLDGLLRSPQEMAEAAGKHLDGVYFDTMVGTGMSGAMVVPILAREMGKSFLVLRKPGDRHGHHPSYPGGPGEGMLGNRWLFVDDGVQSGETVRRVYDEVTREAQRRSHFTEFAGAYLYGDNCPDCVPMPGRDGFYDPQETAALLDRIARPRYDHYGQMAGRR